MRSGFGMRLAVPICIADAGVDLNATCSVPASMTMSACARARSGPHQILDQHPRAVARERLGRGVGIATGDVWHDRSVDYAEIVDPADPEPCIDDRSRILAHPARADRVKHRRHDTLH